MIYLDNASTTKPSAAAVEAMLRAAEVFGNPSSLHGLGLDAEKLVENSRSIIADKLGVDKKNILFTSGGTEANNTVVFGVARARHKLGMKLVTTKIEHPSVLEAFHQLESEGFTVEYVGVDKDGVVNLKELKNALDTETTLVSVMHVNNETGVTQPVAKIKEIMLERSPYAHLHCDCVQSFGKIDVNPAKMGADIVTLSAHKIHGFKGTGALYVSNMRMLRPMLFGGEQQREMRPGTENVAGILAFGAAARESESCGDYLCELRNLMKKKLGAIKGIKINGSDKYNSGSVLNVSIPGVKAEVLMHALEAKEIYISTGSACSTHKPQPSHVLVAMGLSAAELEGAIRISFDAQNTKEEIEAAADAIISEVNNLRR